MFLVRRTFEICSLSNFSNMQYSIVYYNHHAVYYILMTYLFYNWKFVPFDVLHSLLPPPPSASGNHPSVLNYPWACFFLFCFVLDSVSEIIQDLFFSCLISLGVMPSRAIIVVANGKILFFFLWLNNIPLHTHIHIPHFFSLSIHMLMST